VSSDTTIDFAKMDGLVPAIVQDAASKEVLMVGFFNDESYLRTLESGFVTFWSRTRQKLWMKGETSGNRLRVVKAFTDCDRDTLLFEVVVEGDGLVCHEGTVSCFRPLSQISSDRPHSGGAAFLDGKAASEAATNPTSSRNQSERPIRIDVATEVRA
jgi:phosphoribosyl-AMP cyclohydrolase